MTEQATAAALRIAAVTPFATIDFPGRLSAVVFVRGCPWRCKYCHNDWMQSRKPQAGDVGFPEIEKFLEKRKGLLDGVVFSGGEPCVDPGLPAACKYIKDCGFDVGLHTSGAVGKHLKEAIEFVDSVGLDVKAPPQDADLYDRVAGVHGANNAFLESFEIIRAAGVELETRTTAHPDFLNEEAICATARWLAERGVEHYALQIFRTPPQVESALEPVTADWPSQGLLDELEGLFKKFTLRRG